MLSNSDFQSKYTVLFSRTPQLIDKLKTNHIVIYPNHKKWNDFSYQIHCKLIANVTTNLGTELVESDLFLAFIQQPEKKENYHSLEHWLRTEHAFNVPFVKAEHAPSFFCMLPDIGSYRKLVRTLGTKTSTELLFEINDLIALKRKGKNNALNRFQNSRPFSLAFMRGSEAFFAFHNAESILTGISHENFKAISNRLELTFHLPSFDNPHKLNLHYANSELIPKRINILIGKNGLGKSQALNRFCRCALRYKNEKAQLIDRQNLLDRPMINRLIAIGTPGETANTFPGERLRSQKLHYRRVNLTRGNQKSSTKNLLDSLIQLVRSEDYIGNNSRWDIFIQAIDKTIDSDNIRIPLKRGGSCFLKELYGRRGEQHSLELWANIDRNKDPLFYSGYHEAPLSSGQLTFFKFALYCSLMIENGCFVLMDEPETHLHPNLISDFVELLDYILESTGSYALIATHSAYFVREVSREQVHIFKRKENEISIEQPRLKTFGADVDSISEFIFEDNISNRMLKKIARRGKDKSFDEINREIGNEVSYQSLMAIRDLKRGKNE